MISKGSNFDTDGTPGVTFSGKRGLGLGYQAMTGLSYAIDDRWTVFGGYRYYGTTKSVVGEYSDGVDSAKIKVSKHTHALEVGIRFNF